MGPSESIASPQSFCPYRSDNYVPFSAGRMEDERSKYSTNLQNGENKPIQLAKDDYNAIWTIEFPSSIEPVPRSSQWVVNDPTNHRVFIGYGMSPKDELLNDCWILDTEKQIWIPFHTSGAKISPRSATKGVLYHDHIFLFGGYDGKNYIGDLHTINVTNGEITQISTTGESPSPRASPIISAYQDKLYLFGGYDGDWPCSLYVLDLKTLEWKEYPQHSILGRGSIPYVTLGSKIYGYGCSKSSGMLVIDMETNKIYIQPTKGVEPKSSTVAAGMVHFGDFFFYFGGRDSGQGPWSYLYACSISTWTWFIFNVIPDGETVSLDDGKLTKDGTFQLPRLEGYGAVCLPERREFLAFLGSPQKDPPPFFILKLDKALPIVHLHQDMNEILHLEF